MPLFTRPGAILASGEIADAVRRQQEYVRLSAKGFNLDDDLLALNPWERLKLRWLHRQPRIHIDNFDPTPSHRGGRLGPNSYDLHVAGDLLVYRLGNGADQALDRHAKLCLDARQDNPTDQVVVPPDGLVLRPGVLYLGKTVEHTESYNVVPYLDGRSSTGRLGLWLHVTAGRGDRGFRGRWTCEMTVVHPLRIYPDMRLCQITFHTVLGRGHDYGGRYQDSTDAVASRLWQK